MKRKGEAFIKVLEKVKLILVNIRFKLDISMPIIVTNPSIRFGMWQQPPLFKKLKAWKLIQLQSFQRILHL